MTHINTHRGRFRPSAAASPGSAMAGAHFHTTSGTPPDHLSHVTSPNSVISVITEIESQNKNQGPNPMLLSTLSLVFKKLASAAAGNFLTCTYQAVVVSKKRCNSRKRSSVCLS